MRPTAALPALALVSLALAGCPDDPPPERPSTPKVYTETSPPPRPLTETTSTPRPTTTTPTEAPPPRNPRQPRPTTEREQPQPLEPQKYVVAAYSLRRDGSFDAAAAAFEQGLEDLPPGPEKRLVGTEAADMFKVTGRLDKALNLYRRHHDYDGEFEVLFAMNRVDEALTVARLVKQAAPEPATKAEAQALARLGRVDEALQVVSAPSFARERARLLYDAHRWSEAAAAYNALGDYYAQGQALEALGDGNGARRAYEDAKTQVADELREFLKTRMDRAKAAFERAPNGVARERARLLLAKALADASERYEHLALIYARTGQPPEKCAGMAQMARKFASDQRDMLLDRDRSGRTDKYGERAVEYYKLGDRLADLDRKVAEYGRPR